MIKYNNLIVYSIDGMRFILGLAARYLAIQFIRKDRHLLLMTALVHFDRKVYEKV